MGKKSKFKWLFLSTNNFLHHNGHFGSETQHDSRLTNNSNQHLPALLLNTPHVEIYSPCTQGNQIRHTVRPPHDCFASLLHLHTIKTASLSTLPCFRSYCHFKLNSEKSLLRNSHQTLTHPISAYCNNVTYLALHRCVKWNVLIKWCLFLTETQQQS